MGQNGRGGKCPVTSMRQMGPGDEARTAWAEAERQVARSLGPVRRLVGSIKKRARVNRVNGRRRTRHRTRPRDPHRRVYSDDAKPLVATSTD